jgi:nicotinate-nucleotide adenylyltransferase
MRIGIFGGSFDPVHNGHLGLARCCQRQASLDEVWFTPAAVQPLKQQGPRARQDDRLAMLELALASEPGSPLPQNSWRICRLEIDRGGLSYTVDTLRQIHAERPEDELFVLLGSDTLSDLGSWREPEEIFRLARPLFVHRAGAPQAEVLPSISGGRVVPQAVEMPAMTVSSSEIRRRIAAGQPIDELVPPAVAAYISQNGLYR